MKVHEFIARLDNARRGHHLTEKTDVADAPSHAPTSGKDHTTTGQGKSEDQGETVKKGYKQPSASIPAPVAPAPSHAPTSGKDPTTTGQGKSEDEGEKISKEAIKEAVNKFIDADDDTALKAILGEGAHKAGCQCGFCKNKGKMGKKSDETEPKDSDLEESYGASMPGQPVPHLTAHGPGPAHMPHSTPFKRRMGGGPVGPGRVGFRSPVRPRPKASLMSPAMTPMQPAMERLNTTKTVQDIADRLLDSP